MRKRGLTSSSPAHSHPYVPFVSEKNEIRHREAREQIEPFEKAVHDRPHLTGASQKYFDADGALNCDKLSRVITEIYSTALWVSASSKRNMIDRISHFANILWQKLNHDRITREARQLYDKIIQRLNFHLARLDRSFIEAPGCPTEYRKLNKTLIFDILTHVT